MISGTIFDIQHFCTHDGPGIRTVVFLKGCPMACPWCHNPEGRGYTADLLYADTLCIGCGICANVCPADVHIFDEKNHTLQRDECQHCFACAEACPTGALEVSGRKVSVEDVMADVLKDRVFYNESGGGITLSGGEPLAQPIFTCEILKSCKSENLHTCVETSGNAPQSAYKLITPYVDLFLWDVKDTNRDRHQANTGFDLDAILSNLRMVDNEGCASIMRCIILKNVNLNNDHLAALADIYHSLKHCIGIQLLPYHPLGESKLRNLGREAISPAPDWACSADDIRNAESRLRDVYGVNVINL